MNIQQSMVATSLFVSSFIVSPHIFAATTAPNPAKAVMEKTTSTTTPALDTQAVAQVEYALPYPGILPDHPLYFLKKLRDQIMEKLIVDPVRKIEFYMLQADKSINTGLFLVAKQNETLAQESFVRGQKYYGQAVELAGEIKTQAKEVPPYLVERFVNASGKYITELTSLAAKATETQKTNLLSVVDAVATLASETAKLK